MFLGTHSPRLDDKGRLFLPAKFRDRMADGLVVTRGQERCLYVFPMDEFLKVTQQMQAAPDHEQGGPRLHPRLPLRRLRRGAGQAGPRHDPGQPARLRGADPRVHRHRRRLPRRGLGHRRPGPPTSSPPSRASPTSPRRSSPDSSDRAPDPLDPLTAVPLEPGLQPLRIPGRLPPPRAASLGADGDLTAGPPQHRAEHRPAPHHPQHRTEHHAAAPTTTQHQHRPAGDVDERTRNGRRPARSRPSRPHRRAAGAGPARPPAPSTSTAPWAWAATPRRILERCPDGPRRGHRPRPGGAGASRPSGSRRMPVALTFVHAVYDEVPRALAEAGVDHVDAALFDLGVSSLQLDEADRGFSYSQDAPLDMRMDQSAGLTAAEVLNTYDASDLEPVLREFGEERFARKIVARRSSASARPSRSPPPAASSSCSRRSCPAASQKSGGHPGKRTFQALRIEVNAELSVWARCPAARDRRARPSAAGSPSCPTTRSRTGSPSASSPPAPRAAAPQGLPVELPEHAAYLRLLTRGAEEAERRGAGRQPPIRLGAAARRRAHPSTLPPLPAAAPRRERTDEPADCDGEGRISGTCPEGRPPATAAGRPGRRRAPGQRRLRRAVHDPAVRWAVSACSCSTPPWPRGRSPCTTCSPPPASSPTPRTR